MNIDWELAERIQCTDAEREECVPLMKTLVSFAQKSKAGGLLVLDDEVDNIRTSVEGTASFFKTGIELVIDGTDPEIIAEILSFKIMAGNYKGLPLLMRCIILAGVMGIQAGDNPRILADKLLSFFPDIYLEKKKPTIYFPED
ncbi:MAG TPA: hypothetical protein PKN56_00440 [Leptospiraceae bacterium]|nr:hypothetical protein [Leptospiraceae bacterium]HNN02002.1 hypothetical protein [Leptospiraceae bacterium]